MQRDNNLEVSENACLIMGTKRGQIKKTYVREYANIRSNGLIAITLQDGDELIGVKMTEGNDEVMMATRNGQMIRFSEQDVRTTGRSSMGVRGISLTEDDEVIDMQLVKEGTAILAVTENGMGKRTLLEEFNTQHRGGKGVLYYRITDKTGKVVGCKIVEDDQELMIMNSEGIMIRMKVSDISQIGRVTSGVKLISLDEDVRVVSLAPIQEGRMDSEDPDEEEDSEDDLSDLDFTEE